MNQEQNDFDYWIRKLADEAESPFHEASWLKMEELLDNKKKKRIFWWFWPLGIIGTIMISGLIYFNIQSNNTISNTELSTFYDTRIQAETLKLSTLKSPSTSYSILSTIQNVFTNDDYLKTTRETNLIKSSLTSDSESTFIQRLNNVTVDSRNGNTAATNTDVKKSILTFRGTRAAPFNATEYQKQNRNEPNRISNKAVASSTTEPKENATVGNQMIDILIDESQDILRETRSRNAFTVNILSYHWPFLSTKRNALQMPLVANTFKKPKARVYSSILFSIHASPEITSVPSRSYGSISKEYGFNIGYQFTPHLSLSTGLQMTNKVYSAKQGDYEISNNTYLYGKVIENIDGSCAVIEWPINIGYKFIAFRNNYIQINAGLASLRMDKETYNVDYAYWKGGRVNRKVYNFANKSWEMWSSAIFSVTYIKAISKNLSFSINPYIKTPLKGVGNGNIDLKSIGSQIGLNYSLPTLRKN